MDMVIIKADAFIIHKGLIFYILLLVYSALEQAINVIKEHFINMLHNNRSGTVFHLFVINSSDRTRKPNYRVARLHDKGYCTLRPN